jgi:hypothetical protein
LDNDKDGIPDSLDKCPIEPEVFNGYMDEDGCPDTVVQKPKAKEIQRGRVILRGVNFETGKWMDKFSKKDAEYIKRNFLSNACFKSIKLKKVV